jgi:hypothetical protein
MNISFLYGGNGNDDNKPQIIDVDMLSIPQALDTNNDSGDNKPKCWRDSSNKTKLPWEERKSMFKKRIIFSLVKMYHIAVTTGIHMSFGFLVSLFIDKVLFSKYNKEEDLKEKDKTKSIFILIVEIIGIYILFALIFYVVRNLLEQLPSLVIDPLHNNICQWTGVDYSLDKTKEYKSASSFQLLIPLFNTTLQGKIAVLRSKLLEVENINK